MPSAIDPENVERLTNAWHQIVDRLNARPMLNTDGGTAFSPSSMSRSAAATAKLLQELRDTTSYLLVAGAVWDLDEVYVEPLTRFLALIDVRDSGSDLAASACVHRLWAEAAKRRLVTHESAAGEGRPSTTKPPRSRRRLDHELLNQKAWDYVARLQDGRRATERELADHLGVSAGTVHKSEMWRRYSGRTGAAQALARPPRPDAASVLDELVAREEAAASQASARAHERSRDGAHSRN